MNQDQVKEKLLAIEDAPLDFTVLFSGKRSKKVNGLYKPDTREILIHNRNFTDDNLLIYTAIHEYAHHFHACARGGHLSARAHTAEFWAILHGLLEKAETKGVYQNVFLGGGDSGGSGTSKGSGASERSEASRELEKLTSTIRKKYLAENGNMVKELGQLLLKAHELCSAIGGRYEDYIDRVLRIPRQAANLAVRMYQYNLNPETGADNMRFLAGIPNEERRLAAEHALIAGRSPDTVKTALRQKPEDEDLGSDGSQGSDSLRLRLEKEKTRLERTIASLTKRLSEIERELNDEPAGNRA